ncbi:MAG: alpha/beta hydrolase [Pseudoprimorskyibacter sp.]|nr:alpha/beta hydrolase [Pseudoprimorskyibacter sp.]
MQSQWELNGKPFHVHQWGDKDAPLLLMLHGFPEYGGAWSDLAPYLMDRFCCIAPDQRGFGQSWSPADVSDYKMSKLVDDMADLITQYHGRATVLGHDWGAAVAYGLAMFRPDLVDRLIIANGVHPVPFQRSLAAGGAQTEASQYIHYLRRPDAPKALAADDFKKLLALFSANMDLSWLHGATLAEYKRAWRDEAQLDRMLNWYRASPLVVAHPGKPVTDLPELPVERLRVSCPHLLLWGVNDTALLPHATEGLEEFAPDLTRVTLEDADHWLHHQRPRQMADEIMKWIDRSAD